MKQPLLLIFSLWALFVPALSAQPDKVYKSLRDVKNPQDVYILKLNFKRLKAIPDEVFTFSNLRELDLNRNPLQQLPPSLCALSRLEKLILWQTGVVSIPPTFVALDGTLKVLDLRACPLSRHDQIQITDLLPTVRTLWDQDCNCK